MQVQLRYRGATSTVELPTHATVRQLLDAVERQTGVPATRQGLKAVRESEGGAGPPSERPGGDSSRKDAGTARGGGDAQFVRFSLAHAARPLSEVLLVGNVVELKKLPPQIGYRTVFLIEYALPLVAMLFMASRPEWLYGEGASEPMPAPTATAVALFAGHFVKRLAETAWLHRFSRPTMPLSNLWRNAGYYFAAGLGVGYSVCAPGSEASMADGAEMLFAILAFLLCEFGNFAVHVSLAQLPSETDRSKRRPPRGPLFSWVVCPNYTFEVGAWVAFAVLTKSVASVLFLVAGAYQMAVWAKQKHKGYMVSDPEYAHARKALIPFIF